MQVLLLTIWNGKPSTLIRCRNQSCLRLTVDSERPPLVADSPVVCLLPRGVSQIKVSPRKPRRELECVRTQEESVQHAFCFDRKGFETAFKAVVKWIANNT